MPIHANPISAMVQGGALFVWAEVDPDNRFFPHEFHVIGTGAVFPDFPADQLQHIGTVQDWPYVWHVYYRRPE